MPLSVSANCPSCGGALEFEHGSNAVHCGFCGSDHVVTGHGQTLSYYVPEKVPVERAVALALLALKNAGEAGRRAKEATLFFVPFYHFTGQILGWSEVRDVDAGGDERVIRISRVVISEGLVDVLSGGSAPRLFESHLELVSGYVDRTLPARGEGHMGVESLGLRPEVLKLSLFEQKAVLARGRLAPVKLALSEVEARGYAPNFDVKPVAVKVFGRMTSVIYFPFWAVEIGGAAGGEGFVSVVDGVSGEVPNPKAPMSVLDELLDKGGQELQTVGFRPLKCPDCDANLPVRPKDVVFFCGTCKKAWYITGDSLSEVPYSVMPARQKGASSPAYFPFWIVKARLASGGQVVENKYDLLKLSPGMSIPREGDKKVPLRFFVPAFRIGSSNLLSRIASAFTRAQLEWEGTVPDGFTARGAFISPDDALAVAPLIMFSLMPKANRKAVSFAIEAEVAALEASLAFVPFFPGPNDYTDGVLGLSIPSGALRDS